MAISGRIARFGLGLAALGLVACGDEPSVPEEGNPPVTTPTETTPPGPSALLAEVSAGTYELEETHVSVVWRVSHNGLSNYTARFTEIDAGLQFDPADPAASSVTASVNPLSVRTDHPTDTNWDITLGQDEKFFNGAIHPAITFASTGITQTGENTGLITGDLTLIGVTQEVTFEARFNGHTNLPWFGERDVIGFSASTVITRSDFGMDALLPDIGDEVTLTIEAEFVEAE